MLVKDDPRAATQEDELENPAEKHPMVQLARQMNDRDTKIANFKMKKLIETNLDLLKDYKDEDDKRKFYKAQLQLSIMQAFESLQMTEMEN